MRVIIRLILVFYISLWPSLARDKKVSFDAQAALSYIKELASDSMMGRESGQASGVMAEEYIASRLKEWGVEPGGENGTYFQHLTIVHNHIEKGVRLEVIAKRERRNFYYRDEWRVWRFSGSGHFTAEIVFVGYGIHAPQKGYNDFEGLDIRGKAALLILETPVNLEQMLEEDVDIQERIIAVQKHGARAVLLCHSPVKGNRRIKGRITKKVYKSDFVILRVEANVSKFIFKDLKTELRYLLQEIDKTSKPMPYETGVKAFVSVNASFDEKRPARNVLGKISGTDKKLKDECIIIGAHMDHLGINPIGEVMNGANDNASGTAVAMELARVLKLDKAKLKRTIIFFLWAAEEQGYQGLPYYLQHPLYPLDKTVVYINMDMVGHGSGKVKFSGTPCRPDLWELLKEKLPKKILDYIKPVSGCQRITVRKTSFPAKGAPRFGLATDGYHFKFHQSRDDADLIQPEILKRTGDFMLSMVRILGSEPGNLIPPLRQEKSYLRHLTLINFKISPLNEVAEHHKDAQYSPVDLQLAAVKEKKGLNRDLQKVEIINDILNASDKIKKAKGLSLFSSSIKISSDNREGKTTVMAGLKGVDAFGGDPRWFEILSEQGIAFVLLNNPIYLFEENRLSEEGNKFLEALGKNRILPLFSKLDASQTIELLKHSKKPLILFDRELPDAGVLDLIKKGNS